MTDADYLSGSGGRFAEFWRRMLARTTHTASRAREFRTLVEVRVRNASTGLLEKIAGPGWLAVGDAASVYDPLSAAGIGKALHSGLEAASAIHRHLSGNNVCINEYAVTIREQFQKYLEQRNYYYHKERRWVQNLFWQRRQAVPTVVSA
jgi:flavin-dependent dehydrogenase